MLESPLTMLARHLINWNIIGSCRLSTFSSAVMMTVKATKATTQSVMIQSVTKMTIFSDKPLLSRSKTMSNSLSCRHHHGPLLTNRIRIVSNISHNLGDQTSIFSYSIGVPSRGMAANHNDKANYDSRDQQDYNRAISDLNSLQSNSQVLALAKYKHPETILPLFQEQLSLIGIIPEDLNRLNAVHISGTKGKGSTCAFLEGILLAQSKKRLKVGSYNSPHLINVTERIRINGTPIERTLFTKYFRHVFDKLKLESKRQQIAMPSYFAFLTILAFHIFLEERVDCAMIEVGIGGEYDPTNILPAPIACAITTLDLDHTNILGNTIKSIAWTKAGIIKPGVPLFTIEHEQPEALESIRARAFAKGSEVLICKPLDVSDSQLGIKGSAQSLNAAISCQLARYFLASRESNERNDTKVNVSTLVTKFEDLPKSFKEGLSRSCLPGRCQVIEHSNAIYFIDGAHTRKSMENCLNWFIQASNLIDKNSKKILMVNVIGERNKSQVLQPLNEFRQLFDKIIFTSNRIKQIASKTDDTSAGDNFSDNFVAIQDANHERGIENVKNNARVWAELSRDSKSTATNTQQVSIIPCIMQSLQMVDDDESSRTIGRPHVLATGSLHFVGAIMEGLQSYYQEAGSGPGNSA